MGATVEELQARMSSEEFNRWVAFDRYEPIGHPWQNLVLSTIRRDIERTIPRKKGEKLPPLEKFGYQPPAPLFDARMKRQAKRMKARRE